MNIISSDVVILKAAKPEISPATESRINFAEPELLAPAVMPSPDEIPKSNTPVYVEINKPPGRISANIRIIAISLIGLTWLLGLSVGFGMIIAGYVRLRKIRGDAHHLNDVGAIEIFYQVRERIGITRNVRLLASSKARTPFSAGFFHPCIIVNEVILASQKKLRLVLIHEMIHLKQFDDLINLLCRAIGSFMFFHPFFHLAVRELQLSNEQVCDGWTIRLTGEKEDYAECLIELSCASAGSLPIGFGENGLMARRMKSIFKEEVFKMASIKKITFLAVSLVFLIIMVSSVRLVKSASEPFSLQSIEKFQRCDNRAGAGFFWVDTTTGKTWWEDPGNARWIYGGYPEGEESGEVGTYIPCPNKGGAGLFIVKTTTGEAWWARGYEVEWTKLELGRTEDSEAGKIGTYMPCEKSTVDGYGGLFVLNTSTGSGWYTPPDNKRDWYTNVKFSNPDASAGEIGTYMPYMNKSGAGLFILDTASGKCWWANGEKWSRLDKGEARGGEVGTYTAYENMDGAGIFVLSNKTGEGWWTNGGDWVAMGIPSEKHLVKSEEERFILQVHNPEPGEKHGKMILNSETIASIEELGKEFQNAKPEQKKMLIIQAERDVPHDQFVEIMDYAKKSDISKIGFSIISKPKLDKKDSQRLPGEKRSDAQKTEAEILLDDAQKLFDDKKFPEAIKAYQEIYDRSSSSPPTASTALMMIGLCYNWLGYSDKAIEYLEKSINDYPDMKSPATYYYLGGEYNRVNQKEKAVKALKKCIEICEELGREPDGFPYKPAKALLQKL